MPTYQYACTECDERLEVRQSFTDDALTVCPACEGRLRKIFNAVGVVFKGSGFYKTDSRQPAKSSAGRESGESGGSGDSGKSDSGKGSEKGAGEGSGKGSGKGAGNGKNTAGGSSREKSGGSSGSSSSAA